MTRDILITCLYHMIFTQSIEWLVRLFDVHVLIIYLFDVEAKYGGHGYLHIPQMVIPKMKLRGISDKDIETMTVTGPKKWLIFD